MKKISILFFILLSVSIYGNSRYTVKLTGDLENHSNIDFDTDKCDITVTIQHKPTGIQSQFRNNRGHQWTLSAPHPKRIKLNIGKKKYNFRGKKPYLYRGQDREFAAFVKSNRYSVSILYKMKEIGGVERAQPVDLIFAKKGSDDLMFKCTF